MGNIVGISTTSPLFTPILLIREKCKCIINKKNAKKSGETGELVEKR